MAGDSGTPLAKKLGIRADSTILLDGAPDHYPAGEATVAPSLSNRVDIVHLFTKSASELAAKLWVSWPKKSSEAPTHITEDVIRQVALPIGFVDVKVCAVDEVWSGLKLVIRRELRDQ